MKDQNKFLPIELVPYFNADGISSDENPGDGVFGLMTALPAEELPESSKVTYVNDIPFVFPPKEDGYNNNIECYNEVIEVPKDNYCKLHLIGACDNGSFEENYLMMYDGVPHKVKVGITNMLLKEPLFNEQLAFAISHVHIADGDRPTKSWIWHKTVDLNSEKQLEKITLPDNPCYHILCMTLERR